MRKLLVVAAVALVALGGWAQVRTGAWVDEVVFIMEPTAAKAVDMVKTGALDVFAWGIATPALIKDIVANMGYEIAYGLYNEITFNPYGPEFKDGRLNPFSVPAIREAMNWLYDRDKVIADIYEGIAGVPRYFTIAPFFPDYARLADVARALELKYAPNPAKAKEIITAEMLKLGATLVGGKWHYKGKPVEIINLIRVEDERRRIGDYVSGLLEGLGFTIVSLYKTAGEASPIWIAGDPAEGLFHVYTGGWISTVISRDEGGNFNFFYTPRGRADPLWQAYKPSPEFDEVADLLARRVYSTMDERRDLYAKALELSMKDSVRVWSNNRVSYMPRAKNVAIPADLAAGIQGSWLWSRTIRFTDKVGGTMRIGQNNLLTEPWNPIAGTNWIFDMMIIRGTADSATLPDPFTGLYHPQDAAKVEVIVEAGLPVAKTLDWVDLKFAPKGSITVPADAWADWDAAAKRFITTGERFGGPVTSRMKSVVYMPKGFFAKQWHDGSKMSLGDCILGFILSFDRAKPDSPIHDPAAEPAFKTFMAHFKGLKILSTDPLVYEVYSDLIYLDAEWIASSSAGYLYPYYSQGPGAWHTLALGIRAEGARELAFSSSKARRLGVEWMSYLSGPSLPILERHLAAAKAEGYIPYAEVLGAYITPAEAAARYAALDAWYKAKGHMWVANGVLYLDSVKPVEKIIVLKRFEAHPDPVEKWVAFAEPKLAVAEVVGPTRVKIGGVADFFVDVSFKDLPYPVAEINFVKYLVFDAAGNLVISGDAAPVAAGQWLIRIPAAETAKLPVGSNRIEVVVSSKVVAIPAFASTEFVTVR